MLFLFPLTAVSQWGLLRGRTIIGMDSTTRFYPRYFYLGESLQSREILGWNRGRPSGLVGLMLVALTAARIRRPVTDGPLSKQPRKNSL